MIVLYAFAYHRVSQLLLSPAPHRHGSLPLGWTKVARIALDRAVVVFDVWVAAEMAEALTGVVSVAVRVLGPGAVESIVARTGAIDTKGAVMLSVRRGVVEHQAPPGSLVGRGCWGRPADRRDNGAILRKAQEKNCDQRNKLHKAQA